MIKVFIRDPLGDREEFWELSEKQVEDFVDPRSNCAYASCFYKEGKPEHQLIKKIMFDKWDEISFFLTENPNLSDKKKAEGIKKITLI